MRTTITFGLSALLALFGCASDGGVREVSPGVYRESETGDGYISAPRLREQSLERAQEFCAHQGKQMRVAGEDSQDTRGAYDKTIKVTFRCVDG